MTKQNWNAQDYARNSSAQRLWANELIDKLKLRGDETVLDLGSGDGKITAELAERGKTHVQMIRLEVQAEFLP